MKGLSLALLFGLVLGVWACTGTSEDSRPASNAAAPAAAPAADTFDPKADPVKDLAAAVVRARTTNRRIILDVGGEWCSWCHILDRFIAGHAELGAAIARDFVWLKINFSPENENTAFLAKYPRIEGYPHLYVLGQDGELLHSQNTADLELGSSYDLAKMQTFFATWAKK
jgi:thiol:disulfide interchange protein